MQELILMPPSQQQFLNRRLSRPSLKLLQRTSVNITHAGQIAPLQSFSCGIPMMAMLIAYDKPGVPARVA
jgi:hypothetical protein